MVYIINYELKKPTQNYEGLYNAIEASGDCLHAMASTWFLDSDKTSGEVFDTLRSRIDSDDRLFVGRIYGDYDELLPKKAEKWLAERGFRE